MLLAAAAFAATIETCFAPEQNCALLALGAIEAAEREILVNAYALTTVSGIPGALILAHNAASSSPGSPTNGRRAKNARG